MRSASSENDRIRSFLRRYADGKYVDSLVQFVPDTNEFLVVVPASVTPFSAKAAKMLQTRLEVDFGIRAEVSQASEFVDAVVENALDKVLFLLLEDNFVNAVLSKTGEAAAEIVVFLTDANKVAGRDSAIRRRVAKCLHIFGLDLTGLYFSEPTQRFPSDIQILRSVYVASPLSLVELADRLSKGKTWIPSMNWLNRKLDNLVQKKLVQWNLGKKGDGNYSITALGVSLIPRNKGRNSPDIERSLELARRKW